MIRTHKKCIPIRSQKKYKFGSTTLHHNFLLRIHPPMYHGMLNMNQLKRTHIAKEERQFSAFHRLQYTRSPDLSTKLWFNSPSSYGHKYKFYYLFIPSGLNHSSVSHNALHHRLLLLLQVLIIWLHVIKISHFRNNQYESEQKMHSVYIILFLSDMYVQIRCNSNCIFPI